jgi:threonine dehydrogenase-like Zn-dependent dehydrogenase
MFMPKRMSLEPAQFLGRKGSAFQPRPPHSATASLRTDGRAVDCVVEIAGPGTIAMSLQALAVGGPISLIGASLSRSGTGLDPRTADRRGATRKTMIVALARKLLIALWRFVTTGETLEGVVLRPAG